MYDKSLNGLFFFPENAAHLIASTQMNWAMFEAPALLSKGLYGDIPFLPTSLCSGTRRHLQLVVWVCDLRSHATSLQVKPQCPALLGALLSQLARKKRLTHGKRPRIYSKRSYWSFIHKGFHISYFEMNICVPDTGCSMYWTCKGLWDQQISPPVYTSSRNTFIS